MGKIVAFDKYSKEISDEKDGSSHRINIVRQNVGKSRGNVNLMLRETGGLLTGQYIIAEPINFVRYTVYMEDFLNGMMSIQVSGRYIFPNENKQNDDEIFIMFRVSDKDKRLIEDFYYRDTFEEFIKISKLLLGSVLTDEEVLSWKKKTVNLV